MYMTLKTKIMLRVWYSYGLRVLCTKNTLKGAALGASTVLFVSLVSVPHVIKNFMTVQVGEIPTYTANVFLQALDTGEIAQLVALGVIVFSLLSFRLPARRSLLSSGNVQHV